MEKTTLLLVLFVFLFLNTSFAQTDIKAEVDKTTLTTDDTLIYKITITASDNNIPAPQVPKFEGFSVLSTAQSSTMSFVKNNIKNLLVYAFVLAPLDAGKFKIAPTTIKIKDKVYSTDSFEIEVTQGKTKPQLPQEEKPALPQGLLPEAKEPQTTL